MLTSWTAAPTQPPLHPLKPRSLPAEAPAAAECSLQGRAATSFTAAFSVHPVRISKNLESYDNMEHQMRMSFPSTAAGDTGGCIESMWSCLVEIRSRSNLKMDIFLYSINRLSRF